MDISTQKCLPNEAIIKISKLNPNVKEFVPRSVCSSTAEAKLNTQNQIAIMNNPKRDLNINERIDVTKLKPEQIKDLTAKLKNKIKDSSKVNTLHNKKEKFGYSDTFKITHDTVKN